MADTNTHFQMTTAKKRNSTRMQHMFCCCKRLAHYTIEMNWHERKKKTHYVLIFISLNITPQIRCILKNHIKLIKAQLSPAGGRSVCFSGSRQWLTQTTLHITIQWAQDKSSENRQSNQNTGKLSTSNNPVSYFFLSTKLQELLPF